MKSPELKDRLEESEKLIQEMTVTWEEKLRKTEEIAQVCVFWLIMSMEAHGNLGMKVLFLVPFRFLALLMANLAPLVGI